MTPHRVAGPTSVGVLLLVLALPAVAADLAELRFVEDFASAQFYVEGDLEGQAAAAMRSAIDSPKAGGNGDGQVTQGEAVHFVFTFRSTFAEQVEAAVRSGNMTLDGKVPVSVELLNATLIGAPGPVSGTGRITTVLEANLGFAATGKGRHTFAITAQDPSAGTVSFVVHSPASHVIEKTPEAVVADDGRSVQLTNAGGAGDLVVVFVPATGSSGTQGIPALGWSTTAAAIAGLALLRRVQGQK